jgi:hypothetical protein
MTKEQAISLCREMKEQGDIKDFYVDPFGVSTQGFEEEEFRPFWPPMHEETSFDY